MYVVDNFTTPAGFNARVLPDEDAGNPRENDHNIDGIVVWGSFGTADKSDPGPNPIEDALWHASDQWRGVTGNREGDLMHVERYVRMFHDVRGFATVYSRHGDLVICAVPEHEGGYTDPQAAALALAEEYRAWADGEAYGIEVIDPDTGANYAVWGLIDTDPSVREDVVADLDAEVTTRRGLILDARAEAAKREQRVSNAMTEARAILTGVGDDEEDNGLTRNALRELLDALDAR